MSKNPREFQEYLITPKAVHVSQGDYEKNPASAFLKYTVEAKDAVEYCKNKFPRDAKKQLTVDAQEALTHIISAFLPTVMGHFEAFQKYLFAGIFEATRFIPAYNIDQCFDQIGKNRDIQVDPKRLAAFRGFTAQAGLLLADSLNAWHSPETVNSYFKALKLKQDFFSPDDRERLKVLWQLRHSVVHTAGILTRPDAQKVTSLQSKGDKHIAFENNFTFEVSRKLHRIIKESVGRLETDFRAMLPGNLSGPELAIVKNLFEVKSSVKVWLK